jgi:sucrose-phosphate synthase
VERYLTRAGTLRVRGSSPGAPPRQAPLTLRERFLISDIDGTLIGDRTALAELLLWLDEAGWGFGIATGRRLESALAVLEEWSVPAPDVLITAVGAEIHYGPRRLEDDIWARHLDYRWQPEAIRARLLEVAGASLVLQAASEQRRHKISFDVDPERPIHLGRLRRQLREVGLHASLVFSHGRYLDALPIRCSKGQAIRWIAQRWGIDLESIVVAGDSGNDRDMLTGATPAIVVGNHAAELSDLAQQPNVHFAERPHAGGILEGLAARGMLETTPTAAS